MASLEDDARTGGGHPEPSPRREPPTIDVEAVEMPVEGAAAPRIEEPDPPKGANTAEKASRPDAPAARSRWAIIGSLAAVVLAAAAGLWIYYAPGGGQSTDALSARVASLEAQHRDDAARLAAGVATADAQRAAVTGLTARLAKLEAVAATALGGAPADVSVTNRLTALEAAVKPMAVRLDDIDRQIRDNAPVAGVAGETGENKRPGADETAQSVQRVAIEGLEARVAVLEGLEATLKSAQERADKSVALAAAAAATEAEKPLRATVMAVALRAAVERAYPFTTELAAARTQGLDVAALAALQPFAAGGVPSPNELFRELSGLMPQLTRVSLPVGHDGNYLERLQAGAERLVRIRPVGDVPGDDVSTVIGRIEFKMARQDVAGVVEDIEKLPGPARELAQPWQKKALAREAAINAARQLATAAFAQLGEAPDLSPR